MQNGNDALSKIVVFILSVQVAVSLIVFARLNQYHLQTLKSVSRYRDNKKFTLRLTSNAILVCVKSTKWGKAKNRGDNYYYK